MSLWALGYRSLHHSTTPLESGFYGSAKPTPNFLLRSSSQHLLQQEQLRAVAPTQVAQPDHLSLFEGRIGNDRAVEDAIGRLLRDSHKKKITSRERTDLRSLKGVGPKNEALLVGKGVRSVAELMLRFTAVGSRQAFIRHLREDIGIRFQSHCKLIAEHLSTLAGTHTQTTLCVEGNISAGKSTFLKLLDDEISNFQEAVEVVPEPVKEWQNVNNSGNNILEAFYKEPERYAYTFQNYVFLTRMMQEWASRGDRNLRLLERSIFSDRMVFARAVHEAQWMSDLEMTIYDAWFDPMVSAFPRIVPDGFIYLRASPGTCLKRMQRRSRSEEVGVSLDYLAGLHFKHEEWLNQPSQRQQGMSGGDGVGTAHMSGNGNGALQLDDRPAQPSVVCSAAALAEPDIIAGKVSYLSAAQAPTLHRAIEGVPALVLDCDADVDFARDAGYKRDIAAQVSAYFQFVKQLKERRAVADATT